MLRRGVFTRAEYAAIAFDTVALLNGQRLDGLRVTQEAFVVEAMRALGVGAGNPQTIPHKFGDVLGAYSSAVGIPMSYYAGGFDIAAMKMSPSSYQFGAGTAEYVRRTKIRLRAVNRIMERLDAWRGEQAKLTPNLDKSLWAWILAVIGMVATYILGTLRGS